MDDFEGFTPAKNFFIKLPVDVQKYAEMKINKRQKEMKNKKTEMEKEISPDDGNVCSNKGTKKKREKKEKVEKSFSKPDEVDEFHFANEITVDPFKDSKVFANYCREFMSLYAKSDLRLEGIGVASEYAGHILDSLIDIGKNNDKVFLDAWLKNYLSKLTTLKMKNVEYTSLRALGKSLSDYNKNFLVP